MKTDPDFEALKDALDAIRNHLTESMSCQNYLIRRDAELRMHSTISQVKHVKDWLACQIENDSKTG